MSRTILEKIINGAAIISLVIFASGCNTQAPRARIGTLPTPPPGPRFYEPNNLGSHSYFYDPFEKDGIVFTCKAGHIDVTHVRWSADHTKYLINKTRENLMAKNEEFTFKLPLELSEHKVRLTYPEGWDELPRKEEKEKIIDEVAFEAGQYLAFNAGIWHEILTWFGVHFAGVEPEFNSSFSWEDTYSNVLGTMLGAEAVKDTENSYDKAMQLAIDRKLRELDVKSKSTAINASEKMRGEWFTGVLFVDTIRKNLDIGLDDGFVSPVIVPGICEDVAPDPLPVPTTDVLSKHGFKMEYEIYPREWEKDKILKVVYPDKKGKCVKPERHFPMYMDHIRREAVEKYNYIID